MNLAYLTLDQLASLTVSQLAALTLEPTQFRRVVTVSAESVPADLDDFLLTVTFPDDRPDLELWATDSAGIELPCEIRNRGELVRMLVKTPIKSAVDTTLYIRIGR